MKKILVFSLVLLFIIFNTSCTKDEPSQMDSTFSAKQLYEELSNFTPASILNRSRDLDIENRNFIAFSQDEIVYLSSLTQTEFVSERENLFLKLILMRIM